MSDIHLTVQDLALFAAPPVIGLALGILARRVLFPRLARAAARTTSTVDDAAVQILRGPVPLWGFLLGAYVAATVVPLPPGWGLVTRDILLTLTILSVTWVASRLAVAIVDGHATRALGALPSVQLLTNVVRVTILLLGGFIVLETLGISITPLLTALGVGGLAVGLALQDTLANLFAGVHILVSRQVRVGDFVRLSSGEEGYIQDITWRYTTIRQLPNNLTIVPNAKLASSVTANFTLPDTEQAVLVEVGVGYDSDFARVEQVTVEVGRGVMTEVEGGVPGFTPFIRLHTLGDSSVQFTVILRGRDYVSQYLIKHEFLKRLLARYRAEGIEIPFPIRTVRITPPSP